jgi:hypothetical protein
MRTFLISRMDVMMIWFHELTDRPVDGYQVPPSSVDIESLTQYPFVNIIHAIHINNMEL